jgi:hypothetical protein
MIASRWSDLLLLLQRIMDQRLELHFKGITPLSSGFEKDPVWRLFEELVPNGAGLSYEERVIVLLALTPHLQPNFLENVVLRHVPGGGDFPELGGAKGIHHRGMLPTGETAQFILSGVDVEARLAIVKLFDTHHFFYQQQALWLEEVRDGEPPMSGRLIISQDWLDRIVFGRETARQITAIAPVKPDHLPNHPLLASEFVRPRQTAEEPCSQPLQDGWSSFRSTTGSEAFASSASSGQVGSSSTSLHRYNFSYTGRTFCSIASLACTGSMSPLWIIKIALRVAAMVASTGSLARRPGHRGERSVVRPARRHARSIRASRRTPAHHGPAAWDARQARPRQLRRVQLLPPAGGRLLAVVPHQRQPAQQHRR